MNIYSFSKFTALFIFIAWSLQIQAGELIVVGDSSSDIGNLASIQGPFPPPFYEGTRISNGPVAVEVLADLLGMKLTASLHLVAGNGGGNYAVAGARAGGDEPIDLTPQVNAFLLSKGGQAPADNLYVFFIGGNDVRDARDASESMAQAIINRAVVAIDQNLRTLIAAGAKAILVVDSPDIGRMPETKELAQQKNQPDLVEVASRRTSLFNQNLANAIQQIESQIGIDLVFFDLSGFLHSLEDDTTALGFTNSEEACFNSVTFIFHPDCENGANFDQFVFFDSIHPTARVYERIGRALFAVIPVQPETN